MPSEASPGFDLLNVDYARMEVLVSGAGLRLGQRTEDVVFRVPLIDVVKNFSDACWPGCTNTEDTP